MAALFWYCSMTIVAAITSGVWTATAAPSFAIVPADTQAAAGQRVTLFCSIADLGRHQVFWSVDQISANNAGGSLFTLGPNTNRHTSYPRFEIVGDASSGEFNLRITDVRASDAGAYICLVNDPNLSDSTATEAGAKLTVLAAAVEPMDDPKCTRDPIGDYSEPSSWVYTANDTLTLTCESKGGVPLSDLAWMRVAEDGFTERLSGKTSVSGDVVSHTVTIKLSDRDHRSHYMCTQTHPTNSTTRDCWTPLPQDFLLDVRFKPRVRMIPSEILVEVLETKTVTITCTAEANPPLTRQPVITLPVNKSAVYPDEGDRSKVIAELTTDDVGKDFYCLAFNDVGIGEGVTEINRLDGLPAWLSLIVIGCVALVLFILITIVFCAVCVDRSELDSPKKDPNRLRPVKGGDPSDNDFIDGYQNEEDMVPIEDFEGGHESSGISRGPSTKENDFETGEHGPRYQNLNEAFQMNESVNSNSFSNPSSTEPIVDPNSE